MRNGDYVPTRWDAQADAVNILFDAKTNSHPENMVGVMSMAGKSPSVLANLTQDISKIFAALHDCQLANSVSLATGINVAQLALKHRQNKNQRQRVIAFVGSPITDEEPSLVQLAKRLKKNNVAVDIVSFGEFEDNEAKLAKFIETVNNHDNSHILTVPPGAGALADTLISSPIVMEAGEDGAAASGGSGGQQFEFGVDPSMDPELAMEQARQRAAEQGTQAEGAAAEGAAAEGAATDGAAAEGTAGQADAQNEDLRLAPELDVPATGAKGSLVPTDASPLIGTAGADTEFRSERKREEALVRQALALSRGQPPAADTEDVSMEPSDAAPARATVAGANDGDEDEEMTEEEAIARAIEMSLMDSEQK